MADHDPGMALVMVDLGRVNAQQMCMVLCICCTFSACPWTEAS
jgi:hypothetical protein